MRRLAGFTLAATVLLTGPALAQGRKPAAPGPALPSQPTALSMNQGQKPSQDPAAAAAGTYVLDPNQTAVIIRVPHAGGYSFSVFRMGAVAGVMSWDPADLEKSRVRVTIDTSSLQTSVPGFAAQLTGPDFLNAKLFPDATFVSTAVRRTGPATGEITGNFTLHGVTKLLTLKVDLVGAGSSLRGPTVGFHGQGLFHRLDFGVGPVSSVIGDEVEVVVDLEFDKTR